MKTDGGECANLDPELVEIIRQLNAARDERDVAEQRLQHSTDWYQQRFNALRKWVETEVRPLSEDTARRYYAICANGSPVAHESADWTSTMHGLQLKIEHLERKLALSQAELDKIEQITVSTGSGPLSQRVQEYTNKLEKEKEDAYRRLDGFIKMADFNAECMERHLVSLIQQRSELITERDVLKADLLSHESDMLISERQMTQALKDEFKRGVEALRSEAIELVKHNSHEDGPGLGSRRLESALSKLEVKIGLVPEVRVKSNDV